MYKTMSVECGGRGTDPTCYYVLSERDAGVTPVRRSPRSVTVSAADQCWTVTHIPASINVHGAMLQVQPVF